MIWNEVVNFLDKGVDAKVLIGKHYHTIDAKGRVIIPAKFREDLGSSFVVSKGIGKCLAVYSVTEWRVFEDELLSKRGKTARGMQRALLSDANECEMDDQGRALLPMELRKEVGLQKEIVIIGVSTHAEIWNKADWEEYKSAPQFSDEEIEQAMEELGM